VPRRALLIHNPVARGAPSLASLRAAADALAGWEISFQETEGAGHATMLAAVAAKRAADAVIACGGDGTVNEVVNGVAGSETALAVVRGGTANVWAKEARVPKQVGAAVRLLNDGEVRTVDLGRVRWSAESGGERYFLLMAGVGFDASIVQTISPAAKRRLGAASYLLAGARRTFGHRAIDADITADGLDLSGQAYWLLAANTRSYGGLVNITYHARIDDGALELCLLRKGGLHRLLWLLPFVLLKRLDSRANVVYRRAQSLDITTPGMPVQIDGEYLGETPMRFDLAPGALRVIVPKTGKKNRLFGG
jgi:YegS/Rv2252/BmrU family lipid kinase